MLGLVPSASLLGVDGHAVTVEVHVSGGLPSFTVVGSPDAACREASGRVRAALLSTGCTWPMQRVTVNLAPPTVRKIGSGPRPRHRGRDPRRLRAGRRRPRSTGRAFLGELGLDGSLRPVPGTLCLTEALGRAGRRAARRPAPARRGLVGGPHDPRAARRSAAVVACLRGRGAVARPRPPARRSPAAARARPRRRARPARRPLRARGRRRRRPPPAAAGPAGRRARRCWRRACPGCCPPSTDRAALETTRIHSAAGLALPAGRARPPAAVPGAAPRRVVGGAGRRRQRARCGPARSAPPATACCSSTSWPSSPPTCSTRCASRWRRGWCAWRAPAATVTFPARFLLVAAMNPCPCGYGGRPGGCRCTDGARARYQRRLSGPLLDRFDLRVEVTRPSVRRPAWATRAASPPPPSGERVLGARALAEPRGVPHQRRHPGRPPRRAGAAGPGGRRGAGPGAQERPAVGTRAAPRAAGGAHGRRPAGRAARGHRRPRRHRAAASASMPPAVTPDAGRCRHDRRPHALGYAGAAGRSPGVGPRRLTRAGRGARASSAGWADGRAAIRAADRSRVARPPTASRGRSPPAATTPRTPSGCAPTSSRRRSCSRRATSTRSATAARRHRRAPAAARAPAPGSRASSGRELTDAGVAVVSGLALGIDGAAHRGVLEAGGRPVGVVGCGLDVVYPARHRDLWAARAEPRACSSARRRSASRPTAWRFPARNRIIAGLADLVVVVESHAAGGSMHTVARPPTATIPVMAVPGSVRSPPSAGTNRLLADGCAPVRDATDVLVALGLTPPPAAARRRPTRRHPTPRGARCSTAFDWEPATLEHLAVRTGLALARAGAGARVAARRGWVESAGGWYERVAP